MRAKNMQALTDDVKETNPGVVIYGVGDDHHRLEVSGHNEDDTPGVRAELQDSDNIPEHRAIDVMIGPNFSKARASQLVKNIASDPAARKRLYYVIWDGHEYSRDNGWTKADYAGDDPHTGHIHFSGWAADDNNTAHWPAVKPDFTPSAPPAPKPASASDDTELKLGSKGNAVHRLQDLFRRVFPAYRYDVDVKHAQVISVDGDFGPQTEAWVKEFQKRSDLEVDGIVGSKTLAKLKKYGYQ